MASPGQLVETLSAVTGLPKGSVVDLDRRLVTANLRSMGGRGRNAALMTPQDTAHLITAILAAPQANQAADAVLRFKATEVDRRRSSDGFFEATGLSDLTELALAHSFVEALACLITSAAAGSLAEMTVSASVEPPQIEIVALTRAVIGRIRISGLPSGLTASLEYALPPGRQAPMQVVSGDLEQFRRITGHTIFAVATLFREENVR